jgi:hypothetical protein
MFTVYDYNQHDFVFQWEVGIYLSTSQTSWTHYKQLINAMGWKYKALLGI